MGLAVLEKEHSLVDSYHGVGQALWIARYKGHRASIWLDGYAHRRLYVKLLFVVCPASTSFSATFTTIAGARRCGGVAAVPLPSNDRRGMR